MSSLSQGINEENEIVVSFLRGELTETEASEFRDRLETEPYLQSELEKYRQAVGL